MKNKAPVFCLSIVVVLLCASCTSLRPTDPNEVIKDEQTRFKEQSQHYPDRDSPQQQQEATEQARKDDMLKK